MAFSLASCAYIRFHRLVIALIYTPDGRAQGHRPYLTFILHILILTVVFRFFIRVIRVICFIRDPDCDFPGGYNGCYFP